MCIYVRQKSKCLDFSVEYRFLSINLNAEDQTNEMGQEACHEYKVHTGDLDSSGNAGPRYELDLAGYFICLWAALQAESCTPMFLAHLF